MSRRHMYVRPSVGRLSPLVGILSGLSASCLLSLSAQRWSGKGEEKRKMLHVTGETPASSLSSLPGHGELSENSFFPFSFLSFQVSLG